MRNVEAIESAIRAVMSSRADKAKDRDRQARNMRIALQEVERLEGAMERDVHTLDALYDELGQAREAQALDAALVGP